MDMTVRELINESKIKLTEKHISEIEARYMAEYVFKVDFTKLVSIYDEQITNEQYENYIKVLNKRLTHYPLQYITNEQLFYGINFYVNEDVLIPRPETEMLVDLCIKFAKKLISQGKRQITLLDMCTGSGAIGISIANELDNLNSVHEIKVLCVDISNKALKVAIRNSQLLNLKNVKLEYIQSDLFNNLHGLRFDMIVSNPPYISPKDIENLMDEVKEFEPHLALNGGSDGLTFYRKITSESQLYLNDGGYLLYEIGHGQMFEVKQLLLQNNYKGVEGIMDLQQYERIVYGIKLNKPD